MRIFFSPDGSDPMLLDTCGGLHELHRDIQAFLNSTEQHAIFSAVTDGSPEPYREFLRGIRISKGFGEVQLTIDDDRWLILAGGVVELETCANKFLVEIENGHTHLYTVSVSLIIESDAFRGSDIAV